MEKKIIVVGSEHIGMGKIVADKLIQLGMDASVILPTTSTEKPEPDMFKNSIPIELSKITHPVFPEMSGKEKRRERRKQERKNKKK